MTQDQDGRGPHGPTGLIGLMAGAHFSHHVLTALLVPLLPFIRNEFGLSYAQSGAVTSAFTIAYGFSQLPAGWISDRVGPRYVLLVGISGVAGAGVMVGLSPVFVMLLAGLVVMGIAGGGYHPAASAVISRVVRPERRGRALGVHIIGGSTSHFVAPLIAAGLVSLVGWRGSFLALSAPVALLGVAVFVLIQRHVHHSPVAAARPAGPDPGAQNGTEPGRKGPAGDETGRKGPAGAATTGVGTGGTESAGAESAGSVEEGPSRPGDAPRRPLATVRMAFFLVLTGFVGAGIATVIPFIPLYLVDVRGIDEVVAASFIAIIYGAGFFAAPLGGWLSDAMGRVPVMIVTGLLTGPVIVLTLVTPFPVPLGILLLFLGTLMFTKMPTAEAHIASVVRERNRATVLGIYFFSGAEGSAILTPLLGAVIDRWGFNAGIISLGGGLLAIAVVTGVVLAFLEREAHRRDSDPGQA